MSEVFIMERALEKTYSKKGKPPYEALNIDLYRENGGKWSFGAGFSVYGMGLTTPCKGDYGFSYESEREALDGAVEWIKNYVNGDPNWAPHRKTVFALLPSSEPELFNGLGETP